MRLRYVSRAKKREPFSNFDESWFCCRSPHRFGQVFKNKSVCSGCVIKRKALNKRTKFRNAHLTGCGHLVTKASAASGVVKCCEFISHLFASHSASKVFIFVSRLESCLAPQVMRWELSVRQRIMNNFATFSECFQKSSEDYFLWVQDDD